MAGASSVISSTPLSTVPTVQQRGQFSSPPSGQPLDYPMQTAQQPLLFDDFSFFPQTLQQRGQSLTRPCHQPNNPGQQSRESSLLDYLSSIQQESGLGGPNVMQPTATQALLQCGSSLPNAGQQQEQVTAAQLLSVPGQQQEQATSAKLLPHPGQATFLMQQTQSGSDYLGSVVGAASSVTTHPRAPTTDQQGRATDETAPRTTHAQQNLLEMSRKAEKRHIFAWHLVKDAYSASELRGRNCRGKSGKLKLDPMKLNLIRQQVFQYFPVLPAGDTDEEEKAFKDCIKAIDKGIRTYFPLLPPN